MADDINDPFGDDPVTPENVEPASEGLVPTHSKTEEIDLNDEVQRSYLDYAMSVIVSRALPDVRDGLKPVHRRVIYTMYDGGYRPDRGWNKCSRVVGDVMGKLHPHGDSHIETREDIDRIFQAIIASFAAKREGEHLGNRSLKIRQ